MYSFLKNLFIGALFAVSALAFTPASAEPVKINDNTLIANRGRHHGGHHSHHRHHRHSGHWNRGWGLSLGVPLYYSRPYYRNYYGPRYYRSYYYDTPQGYYYYDRPSTGATIYFGF